MLNKKSLRISTKTLLTVLAVILVLGGLVGGTIAWLMTQTAPVVNTFTYGDINIDLDETGKTDEDNDGIFENEFEMLPGRTLTKDPKLTVDRESEDCWLFVKLDKAGGDVTVDGTVYDFDDFLEYEIAEGWTQLKDANDQPIEGVYYREVKDLAQKDPSDAYVYANEFEIIKGNEVFVKTSVTKEMLNALDADAAATAYPTLTVTGYAVQMENIGSALEAWNEIQTANATTP